MVAMPQEPVTWIYWETVCPDDDTEHWTRYESFSHWGMFVTSRFEITDVRRKKLWRGGPATYELYPEARNNIRPGPTPRTYIVDYVPFTPQKDHRS